MVRVKFAYKDEWSDEKWNEQECIVSSVQECIDLYGLKYCKYRILEVENIK